MILKANEDADKLTEISILSCFVSPCDPSEKQVGNTSKETWKICLCLPATSIGRLAFCGQTVQAGSHSQISPMHLQATNGDP